MLNPPKIKGLSDREYELVEQVLDYIPYFFNQPRVLYIGANRDEFLFHQYFRQANKVFREKVVSLMAFPPRVDVMEIDRERCMDIKRLHGDWLNAVLQGDVTEISYVPNLKKYYELIVWAYGPSVVPREQVWAAIYNLELMGGIIVLMTPWGKYQYPDNVDVHPLDKNITEFRPIEFLRRGYAVHCMGERDTRGSNLMAWKVLYREDKEGWI